MIENTLILFSIVICLALVVGIVKLTLFRVFLFKNRSYTYYRIALPHQAITLMDLKHLKKDIDQLFRDGFEPIKVSALIGVINHTVNLPERSFFVVLNAACSNVLRLSLPILREGRISIIILIPTFLMVNDNELYNILLHS